MVNHGISTGALFLLVGVIYERTPHRGDRRLRRPREGDAGLRHVLPDRDAVVDRRCRALNGFVGEFLVLLGTFQNYPAGRRVGAIGVVLGAVYMLTLYRNVFFGPVNEKWKELPDIRPAELVTLLPLIALAVAIGLYPGPWLALTENPVTRVVRGAPESRGRRRRG